MNGKDLINLGFQSGPAIGVALSLIPQAQKVLDDDSIRRELQAVLRDPVANTDHPQFAELAKQLIEHQAKRAEYVERTDPAPFRIWGENLEPSAVDQIKAAARLPVAVAGALMPGCRLGCVTDHAEEFRQGPGATGF